ncbi:MAG TPA: preprotein translocase subunit SecA [Candidatus Moranbacteria bacterium]|nr:preprotein translocase subunit SecA [Candidatus Moranbacteria bacterium]
MNKEIARYRRIVTKINKLESKTSRLKDAEIAVKFSLLKIRHQKGETLDNLLPEVFALIREASRRALGLRAFNVQLQGAIAAHEGKIVEMKTGEGKTLTILFPAILNALSGKGVHIITTNDYLAERDARWMGPVYKMFDLTVNYVISTTGVFDRKVAYHSDITYVTNNEVGFDFLRDNMVYDEVNRCQRSFHYAIVDEADSVLIDEAQIPLVIAENKDNQPRDEFMYQKVKEVIVNLIPEQDFQINEKEKNVELTFNGIRKLERLLGVENLYQDSESDLLYYTTRLLRAYHLFQRDRDYVIDNGKAIIVDEFTGRLMPEHRYYQGMHQAIEAKEGLSILGESRTMASITFQYLMKKYSKLTGFTGTAQSAEREFRLIYNKEVVVIPTNRPVKRIDHPDRFFRTREEKLQYLIWTVQEYYFKRRAALIGTRSVRQSMEVSGGLLSKNVPNLVLNAKNTKREAEVIAQAGRGQTVTVATNMAGRGTDIALEEDVRSLGGLMVFGLERHNAKRIDNQLIGRAGRQGDPGESQFLVSAEDDLIRTYFKNKYLAELKRQPFSNKGMTGKKMEKIVAQAQKRMEGIFFDQRVLNFEFDRIMEEHRKAFYRQRNRVLLDNDLREETTGLIKSEFYRIIAQQKASKNEMISDSQLRQIVTELKRLAINDWFKFRISQNQSRSYSLVDVRVAAYQALDNYYNDFESYVGIKKVRQLEKTATLKVLDLVWVDHQRQVEDLQDAALVSSISQNNFFEDYQIQMAKIYHKMFLLIPRVITRTIFRTMDQLLKQPVTQNKRRQLL